jgi:hypothetical protein
MPNSRELTMSRRSLNIGGAASTRNRLESAPSHLFARQILGLLQAGRPVMRLRSASFTRDFLHLLH